MIAYERTLEEERWLFVGNFGSEPLELDLASFDGLDKAVLMSSTVESENHDLFSPYEARLYQM